jgi:hypothetical protein
MIGRDDWKSAHASIVAEARKRLGPPPTEAELEAYMEGRLSARETERIEELLSIYPDFAAAVAAPFPATDAEPGDDGYLTSEEREADWASLRARLRDPASSPAPGRVLPFRRAAEIATAAAAMGFAMLFFYAQSRAGRQSAEPRINLVVAPPVVLEPAASRGKGGDGALTLTAGADEFPLIVPLTGESVYPDYQLDLVSVDGGAQRTVWNHSGLRRFANDTLAVSIPRAFLAPGVYRLVASGVRGKERTELATFLIRVPSR